MMLCAWPSANGASTTCHFPAVWAEPLGTGISTFVLNSIPRDSVPPQGALLHQPSVSGIGAAGEQSCRLNCLTDTGGIQHGGAALR